MGNIFYVDKHIFSFILKKEAQLGSLIEGGDPVDDAVTYSRQELRISGKLGQISQIMICGWIMTPSPPLI